LPGGGRQRGVADPHQEITYAHGSIIHGELPPRAAVAVWQDLWIRARIPDLRIWLGKTSVTLIAMTREMGSLGKDVAAGVATELGLQVIHSEIVEQGVAGRMGVNESAVHRYLEGEASVLERWQIDKRKLSRYTSEETLQLAQQGDVLIRGWGAAALLRDIPHVLSIRVCAPMANRERTMMDRLRVNDVLVVRREIERNDAAHARTMRGLFGVDWEDPVLYHAVLNTGLMSIDDCVRAICQLASFPSFQNSAAARQALSDKLVEVRVKTALVERFEFDSSNVEVSVRHGTVTLSGRTINPALPADAEHLARGITGVNDVDNQIVRVSTFERRI
jgi:cytidylate kinase